MRIRGKLLLGLGVPLALAVALGVFAYAELRAVTRHLAVVEAADDLTATILEVRRYEKNFLLFRDVGSARTLARYLEELRTRVGELAAAPAGGIDAGHLARMRGVVADYEKTFALLAAAGGEAGEGDTLERLRSTARDLQSLAEDLSGRQREGIEALLARSRRSVDLLLLGIVAALALGVLVDAQLSRSIAGPIHTLERLTERVAEGDFSERVGVRGEDEFSSLAHSFNAMQDRLRETLTTLEQANETLRSNRARLAEAEKFATLGRFSAGVAHEINNPLAIINEKAGLMKDYLALAGDFPQRERFRSQLEAITESVARCATITHRILNFARAASVAPGPLDLEALVADALRGHEQQVQAKGIRLVRERSAGLPPVSGGRSQVGQVVADLLKSVLDAAAPGAEVLVRTAARDPAAVVLEVADPGREIPPEAREHLFDPFSTTRESEKDPGLGLWVSRGIATRLGGDLLVESAAGRGTVFSLVLPVAAPAPGEPAG